MSEQLAIATLLALANVAGALRVITNEVRPELRADAADARSEAKAGVNLKDPATFVIHDVTRIEGPNDRGRYRAYTAEGDWTEGHPESLLRRLQEWRG